MKRFDTRISLHAGELDRHGIIRVGHTHVGDQPLLTALVLLPGPVQLLLVSVHVLHHVILADESLATLDARKRLAAGVQAHMSSQVRLVVESLRTLLALERFFSRMLCYMLLVRCTAREPLAAPLTFERLIAAVECLVVLGQVAGLVEHFITNIASIFTR